MLERLRESMWRSDLVTVAVGLALALAAFALVATVVENLIAPLIAVFVGEPEFGLNSFRIDSTDFRYGAAIESVMTFALVAAAAYYLVARRRHGEDTATATRACPECTQSIAVAAKRCPHCTAPVQPESA
jgi:large conductance mechanosensitive channel